MIATESIAGAHREPVFLTRVRLRAQRRLLWLQKIWSPQLSEGIGGLAITPAEVDKIVMNPEECLAEERAFYLNNDEARQLSEQIGEIDKAALADSAWQQLRDQFDLTPPEIDLLALI